MHDSATLIAHILYPNGAILNISSVLRTLDNCLDIHSDGAYTLLWDSEDTMVAQYGQTKIILVISHQLTPTSGFTLTLAISPVDEDAIANPRLAHRHRRVIRELVEAFAPPYQATSVLWQRAKAPVTAEIIEMIVEALTNRIALLESVSAGAIGAACKTTTLETAQLLPPAGTPLQMDQLLPI